MEITFSIALFVASLLQTFTVVGEQPFQYGGGIKQEISLELVRGQDLTSL